MIFASEIKSQKLKPINFDKFDQIPYAIKELFWVTNGSI